MSHLFPSAKGDQLCPLGFHPQVRWPTRCKRCFRDYKEHGNKRGGEDITASTPVLPGSSQSRSRDGGSSTSLDKPVRSWTSTQNLYNSNAGQNQSGISIGPPRPASWASTPDLDSILQNVKADLTVNLTLPRRRHTTTFDSLDNLETTVTIKRPPLPPILKVEPKKDENKKELEKAEDQGVVIEKGDSLAERVRKMNLMKRQSSTERETLSREKSVPLKEEDHTATGSSVSLKLPKEIEPEKVERKRRVIKPIPETTEVEAPSKPQLSLSKTTITSTKASIGASTLAPVKEKETKKTKTTSEESVKDTTKIIRRKRIDAGPFESASKTDTIPQKLSSSSHTAPKPIVDAPLASSSSDDVKFLFSIKDNKSKLDEDLHSISTETTETTIVDNSDNRELQEEIESLKRELETVKARCDRAEREKSDILLRRLASMDTVSNRTAASEALKLQQKVNEQKQFIEDLQDEKKFLSAKVKELETDGKTRGVKNVEEQLRQKLEQAETLCEELMDENEEIKRELRNMETEIEEMHDNFREDQADEYASLKKELDQTTKNCRILSFKLKKSDRKIEQLEAEKASLGTNTDLATRVKQLEDELKIANEVARRLQSEVEQNESNPSTPTTKKAPALGKIGKSTSADNKISRASLTRGGSQEDPVQLLRDLQDSLEREADLREQLKYAEEEAEGMRRKSGRVEEENESLMMQLKKMASKAKTKSFFGAGRKLSPSPPTRRAVPEEKDEGISDEDDPAELRLQLELNEQETAVLRRKIEELESENKRSREHAKELQESLTSKTKEMDKQSKFPQLFGSKSGSSKDPLDEKKIKVMEEEISELRMKLIEKDREVERVQAELSIAKTKGGKSLTKSKSLDADQQIQDLKRQLQVIEQEASVLREKTQTLEQENEKHCTEIKSLQQRKTTPASEAETKKLSSTIQELQKEKSELEGKLKRITQESTANLPSRTAKAPNDMHTKLQLKKMVEDCEKEISELRAIVGRSGAINISSLESEKNQLESDLRESREQRSKLEAEIKKLSASKASAEQQVVKLNDAQRTVQKLEDENMKQNDKIKVLEEKITKVTSSMKATETNKSKLEMELKAEKDKTLKTEKDIDTLQREKIKSESKVKSLEKELQQEKLNAESLKESLEKEIESIKRQSTAADPVSHKIQELNIKNEELISKLEDENKRYQLLVSKHETLEEDHVMLKAQIENYKPKLEELESLKKKLSQADNIEARLVKENTNMSRRLVEMQKRQAELESNIDSRYTSLELEKNRIKSSLEDKLQEYDKLNKENEMNAYQAAQLRKDNDDLRGKLDDYERINKAQRTLSEHNSHLEQELKKMQVQLESAELNVKSEVAATRLRYEQQVTNLHNELTGLQRQCERFKRDRDTFKQLVEAAQKQIGDMKANRRSLASVTSTSSDDDDKSKIVALEQQIGCLEDELSEARLEASKVRTELVSELSASEIKISEMQSKINELEEEKIISGGKSKVPGTKTRLELSWQKEREDMQRLVQETSTLARDLRQTLFEVERERDKEKLESRRKIDQIKKTTEEEIEEGRRKVTELQSDLLELRDAHAKLRTANEKLRRDRERYEREGGTRRRLEAEGERRISIVLQSIDELVRIAPDIQKTPGRPDTVTTTTSTGKTITANTPIPTPPMRHKSPSPGPDGAAPRPQSVSSVLSRLAEASEELRRYQRMCDEEKDRERMRRGGMRRAASQENDSIEGHTGRPVMRLNRNGGSLYKKSLSLDQSLQIEQPQLIWKEGDDSMSSLQSLDSEYGAMIRANRDSSLDSRLSGGSTQSDMPRMRKKKRGIMGKLRSLSLSRNKGSESDYSIQGSDSDLSIAGDISSSKSNLKGKLSGMFRRSGSATRSSSNEALDRGMQRPVAIQTLGNGPAVVTGQPPIPRPVSASTPHLARQTGKPPTPSIVPAQRKRVVASPGPPPTGTLPRQ
ncbi:myosin-2 heavy chain [Uranotaenia lowii]|uniref:myosin-2 heavy chain n=1 Tax=Uranotaenia lowii TaxID=190385 RepID=UPI0024788584|nr:myosin-2 heavy chain [Uranotaenia lowii]XP_055594716.1 myosin-2 heavy chain [Uranotaenia lowii]